MTSTQKHILITSALPYVNNIPHLGNIVGCVLSADVYSRYLKSNLNTEHKDTKILFVGGVDEYGTATEMKAQELKITCRELCDMNYTIHKKVYDWFLIDFDCYGRTSQPNGNPLIPQLEWEHTSITHNIYTQLCNNNYIIEKKEKIMYCSEIDSYVADRYVIGTCPYCFSTKADGDQCDRCGKLLNSNELIEPRYKLNTNYKLQIRDTTNLYIDTPKIWNDNNMTQWFNDNNRWTKTAIDITNDWIKNGINPRSITRDLKWGTIVPDTKQFGDRYSNKVFYVWFDAPIGYISITQNTLGVELSEYWWKNNNTKLVQFMAKDNVPFHSIIFPVTLKGSDYSDIKDTDIVSTNYLMYEGTKFSKSKGTGLFCDQVMELSKKYNLLPDYWRAYLISIRPENNDSNFVMNGVGSFVDFVNNMLIKNIGNLLHRVLSIAFQVKKKKNILFIIKPEHNTIIDISFNTDIDKLYDMFCENMDSYRFANALRILFDMGSRLNVYINNTEPWQLIKDSSELGTTKLYNVVYNLYNNIHRLSYVIEIFMPTIGNNIRNQFTMNNITIILPLLKPVIMIHPIPNSVL